MIRVSGKRSGIFSLFAPDETEVMLLVKPSRAVLAHLLSHTGVKRMLCPPGIFATIPKNALVALREGGVSVEVVPGTRGRPRKAGGEFELARGLAGKVGIKAAIRKSGIARSTYYYRLKQEKNAGN